jgi:hypothetical protein
MDQIQLPSKGLIMLMLALVELAITTVQVLDKLTVPMVIGSKVIFRIVWYVGMLLLVGQGLVAGEDT